MPKSHRSETEKKKLLEELSSLEESKSHHRKKKRRREYKKSTFLLAIIINLFLWYFFDRYFVGWVPFITLGFFTVLPFLKVSLAVNISSNFFLLFHSGRKFFHFSRLSQNLFSLLFLYHFYLVFPFDFSAFASGSSLDLAVRIGLVAALVGTGAASLIEFLEMLLGEE
jgi:hypothetical protein